MFGTHSRLIVCSKNVSDELLTDFKRRSRVIVSTVQYDELTTNDERVEHIIQGFGQYFNKIYGPTWMPRVRLEPFGDNYENGYHYLQHYTYYIYMKLVDMSTTGRQFWVKLIGINGKEFRELLTPKTGDFVNITELRDGFGREDRREKGDKHDKKGVQKETGGQQTGNADSSGQSADSVPKEVNQSLKSADIEEVSDELKGKAIIQMKSVSKKFPNEKTFAVNNVSMTIYGSQITALLGHNGAGKTTLINMMIGVIAPTSGSIHINGYEATDASDVYHLRSMFGICLQENALLDELNSEEHLLFFGAMKGLSGKRLVEEVNQLLLRMDLLGNRWTKREIPTSGLVYICGQEMHSSYLRQVIGYCPQQDTLWKNITVREHLTLFATISGVQKNRCNHYIDKHMKDLKITEHADKETEHLSGGTKRKVCYILSLMGDSKLVLLDEPSTGMDPYSKRFLWTTIQSTFNGKTERSAVLTTHSMEEANALCNRIAIMTRGVMRCIGSAQHLKNRYGAGYVLDIKWRPIRATQASIKTIISGLFSEWTVREVFDNRMTADIPQQSVPSLSAVFSSLERLKADPNSGVDEYSLSQTTLEQVFIYFAKDGQQITI